MTLSSLSCLDSSKLRPSPPPTKIKVHINNEFVSILYVTPIPNCIFGFFLPFHVKCIWIFCIFGIAKIVSFSFLQAPTLEEQSTTESTLILEDSKRKYSELSSDDQCSDDSDDEETIQAKIDRLAAQDDSLDDEDFIVSSLSSWQWILTFNNGKR